MLHTNTPKLSFNLLYCLFSWSHILKNHFCPKVSFKISVL